MKGIFKWAQFGFYTAPVACVITLLLQPDARNVALAWVSGAGLLCGGIVAVYRFTHTKVRTAGQTWVSVTLKLGLFAVFLYALWGWKAAVVPISVGVVGYMVWLVIADHRDPQPPDGRGYPPYFP